MAKARVLVACEFSGTVRDAFLRRGIFAMSCDLLPEAIAEQYGNLLVDESNDESEV